MRARNFAIDGARQITERINASVLTTLCELSSGCDVARMYQADFASIGTTISAWRDTINSEATVTTRTGQQNKSLHLWLSRLADELNASGQSLGDGITIKVPVRFTGDNLKENCLKPLMCARHPDKTSTTELTTKQIQDLYMELDQVIAERSGCHVEWPSLEEMSQEQRE
jgi:hypothetical protein